MREIGVDMAATAATQGMIEACANVVGNGVMPDAMYGVPPTEAKT